MLVFGVAMILLGLALLLNFGGIARWGSQSRWNTRDRSGSVTQNQPVALTRLVGVIPIIIGIAAIAGN